MPHKEDRSSQESPGVGSVLRVNRETGEVLTFETCPGEPWVPDWDPKEEFPDDYLTNGY